MGKPQNTPDVDDDASTPPPAYQETPPFNPHYHQQQEGPSSTYQSPPFNPNYSSHQQQQYHHHHNSPPHTPDMNQSLYPQVPSSPPPQQPQQQVYQPLPPHQARYQTIELPYPSTTPNVTPRMIRRQIEERRKFPLAAIFFLFGWFCPPLWVIGACCCAGSRNEYESFWGKVNFIMAMAMIVTSIIYSIFAMSQYMA